MGKIAIAQHKYLIHAKYETDSEVLEVPDVIGAIFGQTEGLLGEDMEMRDLLKKGKIGRIDIDLENKEITIPSAMSKNETCLIGASLETIEKMGVCKSKIKVIEIEDVRKSKKEFIMERAKQLLKTNKEA